MAQGDYQALGQYFNGPMKNPSPSTVDVAKFILQNATPTRAPGKPSGGNDPSIMSRIFDILSRPNYAIAEFSREYLDTGDPDLSAFWEGLSGKKKTTFSSVLEEAGMEDTVGRSALGLGLDIFADPTTYIPVAGIVSKIKGAKGSVPLAEKPLGQKLLDKGEPVNPEVFGLPAKTAIPEVLKAGPKVGLPESVKGLAPSVPIQPGPTVKVKSSAALVPSVEKKIPETVTETADNIISKIADGDVVAALKLTPMPPPIIGKNHQEIADDIISRTKLTEGSVEISAKQQADMFKQARQAATQAVGKRKRSKDWANKRINEDAIKIYAAVEKSLVEFGGKVPRISSGENVKLSDVIADLTLRGKAIDDSVLREFSGTVKPGSEVWKSLQILKARGAISDAPTVSATVEKILEAKGETAGSGLLSDAQQFDFDKFLKKFGKASAVAGGASEAGAKAAEKLIDFTLRSGKSRAQISVEYNAKALDEIIATGKANPKVNASLTRALEKDLSTLPKWTHNNNQAVEFLMGRVATWWGQSVLRPMSLNAVGSSAATAAVRGKVLDNLFKPFDQATRHEAWKLAQGYGKANTEEAVQLATQIKRIMDNLVGQVSGQSVLLRSGVSMKMLNKWMGHYSTKFQFTTEGKNFLGETVDFSKGTDWVNSWKLAEAGEDPKLFIFKMQQAMEQATREKALFDEIGERFGSLFPGKGYKTKVEGYPYIEGYYFTEDIAKQLPRVIRDWTPTSGNYNQLLSLYDRVLSMWKAGVTIYRPGHHIRNMAGDIYLGWMDGVNSVRPYILAARVQKSMRGAYPDITDIDKLVELGALQKNYKTPNPNEVIFTNRSGVPFTAEQIAAVAHQKGLLEHARTIEDIIDLGDSGRKSILDAKPLGGKVQTIARSASELQSHNTRLAHFIDKVMKSSGKNLPEIFEQASRRARKWHPTGLDLTDYEKKALRRVIPFYSWMRKSLPLLLEGLVMNPGKSLIPSKVYGAIQEAQGIETPGRHDPFPVDQMFPEWIRAQGLGPVDLPEGLMGSLSNQSPPGYVMGGVGLNPLADLMSQFESPGKTLATSVTPFAQIPYEMATGRKTFTGEPISGPEAAPGAMQQFIGEQIPLYSMLQGITGVTPFGTETKKSMRSDSADTEALINFLTGLGVKGTGPYVNQARFEKYQPAKTARKFVKDNYLSDIRQEG